MVAAGTSAPEAGPAVSELAPGVFVVDDTCRVYVIRAGGPGSTGIAIDFGSGRVLDLLEAMQVERLTHVLMTHHHRDQGQGLPRAAAVGIEIWVPPVEVELFAHAEEFWQSRRVHNDYAMRSDRETLLASVPVAGTVPEYRTADFGGVAVRTRPTPGHTTGSVSYLVERDGRRLAFTGDLICAPGKVWSLQATQWTYTGNEGPAMAMISCLRLRQERPDVLLPSHGDPMSDPRTALTALFDNLQAYVDSRRPAGSMDIRDRLDDPFERVTEHLLANTSSESRSYVLLSESGAALVLDYGYDMTTWYPLGGERASQRPWLESVPALKERYGVTSVEVALATHYHDDHCAGMNLLRDVEGTQVWLPANVAPILAQPMRYDLPCQWYESVRADRVLPLGEPVRWQEYTLTAYPLPGHTHWAAAFAFEVDDTLVLATGDQQDALGRTGERRHTLNYQYRNVFEPADFVASARLYRRLAPDVLLTGHWAPRWVDDDLLDGLDAAADELVDLHRALLPDDGRPTTSRPARLAPYWRAARPGQTLHYTVELDNPHAYEVEATARAALPDGWRADPPEAHLRLPAHGTGTADVKVTTAPGAEPRRRAVWAVDVTVGRRCLGQQAEAVVAIEEG